MRSPALPVLIAGASGAMLLFACGSDDSSAGDQPDSAPSTEVGLKDSTEISVPISVDPDWQDDPALVTASSLLAAYDPETAGDEFAISNPEYIDEIDSNIAGNDFRGSTGVRILTEDRAYLIVAGYSRDEMASPISAAFYVEVTTAGTIDRTAADIVAVEGCGVDAPSVIRTGNFDPTAVEFECASGVHGSLDASIPAASID
jgi:hypothetical protein